MSSRNQSDNLKYQHIRYTLLVDPESNDIDHLFRGETITNLRQLKTLVRHPGLVLGNKTFTDENGEEATLSEEYVQELNQNEYIPSSHMFLYLIVLFLEHVG